MRSLCKYFSKMCFVVDGNDAKTVTQFVVTIPINIFLRIEQNIQQHRVMTSYSWIYAVNCFHGATIEKLDQCYMFPTLTLSMFSKSGADISRRSAFSEPHCCGVVTTINRAWQVFGRSSWRSDVLCIVYNRYISLGSRPFTITFLTCMDLPRAAWNAL